MTSASETTPLEPDPRADVTGGDADGVDVNGVDVNGADPNGADPLSIDRLVHEPARMAILSVLDGVADAEFGFLVRVLGLTKGNLSAHLSKLEAAGLIQSHKAFIERLPRTTLSITHLGRQARARHWAQLEALRGLGG